MVPNRKSPLGVHLRRARELPGTLEASFLDSSSMAVSNQSKKNSQVVYPVEMLERGVSSSKSSQSPASSNDRKRSLSVGNDQEGKCRRVSLAPSTRSMPSPSPKVMTERMKKTSAALTHSGVRSYAYPTSTDVSHELSSGPVENSSFSCYESSLTGLDYPGTNHDLVQSSVAANSLNSTRAPPLTKQNRFNLSRYQLDDDDDLFATIPEPAAACDESKPNKFQTQREQLMKMMSEESESDCTATDCGATNLSHGGDESSQDSYISQRERLRRFSNEQCRNVVIPNQWEGETKLKEFVAFGNIEAALRPLGLMMARAALVSDSVNTRHHRPVSSGPTYTTLSNPVIL